MKDDIKVTSRVLEKAGQPPAIMTRDSTQSRAEGKGESEPTQSVGGVLSLKQVVIRKAADVTMDVDGDNLVTIIDLFLVITGWFAFSFCMLLCYFCFDVLTEQGGIETLNWEMRQRWLSSRMNMRKLTMKIVRQMKVM